MIDSSRRVLFVDDEADIVAAFSVSLQMLGWEAVGFTLPMAALECLAAEPDGFGCVITDYTLPQMSCADFVARIRTLRPGLPVHLCTGNAEHEIQEAASRMGISRVLYKPFDFDALEKFLAGPAGA